METESTNTDEVAQLRAELDNKDAQISELKRKEDSLVAEINRLSNDNKQTTSLLLAYRLVSADILKRG